jgi:(p)ppGpp synthase/HD superfamily hydrolase
VARIVPAMPSGNVIYTITAYLHDTIEDTECTHDLLTCIFGAEIAGAVFVKYMYAIF